MGNDMDRHLQSQGTKMDESQAPISEEVQQAIDRFWAVFPSVWHQVRAHIHHEVVYDAVITVSQFHLLRRIHQGVDSVSELASAGHISLPAISRMVDVLANKGLVSRAQDPQDRRRVRLALTDKGENLLKTTFGDTHHWMSDKLAALDADELETIVQGMEALKKAFEE
jgi:DNA-binding MarR family transcriptional regulator